MAVTEEQIHVFNLPTRPTKTTHSRGKNFQGESVEVDAIPPAILRGLVRTYIEIHINFDERAKLLEVEQNERETLERILAGLEAA